MEIKELDKELISRANSNSFNGNRGDISKKVYDYYINKIMNWNIADNKKQKILDQCYNKYSKLLNLEAQHVSVIVAGPANYNSKRLDKGEQILKLSVEIDKWVEDLEKQLVKNEDNKKDKTNDLLDRIKFDIEHGFNPSTDIMKLATIDNEEFIKVYDKYYPEYKWRKNSNIYKLYQSSLNGEVEEIKKEIIFEDENLTAYIEGDRAYIEFIMRPQRQLIVALKSRKWWWNSRKKAWSTYLNKLDKEWVKNISNRYEKYI